ncbi:MAG: hypothetical protein ABIK86_07755 [candidate division WOR-3 bacterium]
MTSVRIMLAGLGLVAALLSGCEMFTEEHLLEMTEAGEVKVTLLANEGTSSALYLYRPIQVLLCANSSGNVGKTFSAGTYPAGTGLAFMIQTNGQTVNSVDNPDHFQVEDIIDNCWRISCEDAVSNDEDFDDLMFEVRVE